MRIRPVTHFIYQHYECPVVDVETVAYQSGDRCALCGFPFGQMVSMRNLELIRYNSWSLHKDRSSTKFCLPCTFVLRRKEFRTKDMIASVKGIRFLQRKHAEDRVMLAEAVFLEPPEPPFVISLPSDYRKHIVPQAMINYNRRDFTVQFGETTVPVQLPANRAVYEAVMLLAKGRAGESNETIGQAETLIGSYRFSGLLTLAHELARSTSED